MLKSLCDILNDAFREARDRSPERFLEAVDAYAGAVAPAEELAGVGLATFADWFLFDYAPGDGATPLSEYAHGLPLAPRATTPSPSRSRASSPASSTRRSRPRVTRRSPRSPTSRRGGPTRSRARS